MDRRRAAAWNWGDVLAGVRRAVVQGKMRPEMRRNVETVMGPRDQYMLSDYKAGTVRIGPLKDPLLMRRDRDRACCRCFGRGFPRRKYVHVAGLMSK
jgi:hypothetical protein